MWVEDLELSGPWVPQMSGRAVKRREPKYVVSVPDGEANDGKGPISRVLDSGVSLVSSLNAFPMIKPMTGPVEWALKAASGAASALGYSKPVIDGEIERMSSNIHAYTSNVMGKDTSLKVTPLSDAKVTAMTGLSIRSVDEASINFIKRQWSYLETFSVGPLDAVGDQIWRKEIYPTNFVDTEWFPDGTGTTGYTVYDMSPIAYLGNLFYYWRGDIELKFVLVKTGYHSGTIAFSYGLGNDATVTYANTAYLHREVIDIQEGNEVCFTIPYGRTEPYRRNYESSGTVYAHIVSQLKSPDTVADSIEVMVFVRGAKNLSFEAPAQSIPMPALAEPQARFDVEPQGNDVDEEGEICGSVIGGGTASANSLDFSQFTVGETISSLNQLAKRYTDLKLHFTGAGPGTASFDTAHDMRPHFLGGMNLDKTGLAQYTLKSELLWGDYLASMGSMFMFHRGGIRLRYSVPGGVGNWHSVYYVPSYSGYAFFNITAGPTDPISPDPAYKVGTTATQVIHPLKEGGAIVSIPQYSRYYAVPHLGYAHRYDDSNDELYYSPDVSVLSKPDVTVSDVRCARAADDDFQFLFFIGVPRMLLSLTAAAP
jgi:hypothetical protein